jgi:hypothetical protein
MLCFVANFNYIFDKKFPQNLRIYAIRKLILTPEYFTPMSDRILTEYPGGTWEYFTPMSDRILPEYQGGIREYFTPVSDRILPEYPGGIWEYFTPMSDRIPRWNTGVFYSHK